MPNGSWQAAWRDALRRRHHRGMLLITGDPDACRRTAVECLSHWPELTPESGVWLGRHKATALQPMDIAKARELTGRQLQVAVVDAYCGLSADALGAVGGCIEGGGVLLLLAPPRRDWIHFQDPAYQRRCPWPYKVGDYASRFWLHLARALQGEAIVEIAAPASEPEYAAGPPSIDWAAPSAVFPAPAHPASPGPANADQAAAVEAIHGLARGRAGRPLVLIAHRGRGKSAALGMAAAQLLSSRQSSEIIVTAARRSALASVFLHAQQAWPDARWQGAALSDGCASLRFVPPDQVPERPQLLLVDEAAALPAIVLRRLLRAPRIVFASTVHGYEGSGRGFDLRFTRLLDQLAPRWRRLGLSQPLRWAADDPLEPLLFRALLLDAEPTRPRQHSPGVSPGFCCRRLNRDRLVADESRLRALFGLLVAAHYRTTPDDLRELLDAPQMRVWAVTQGPEGPIVGAALVAEEGGLPDELAAAVRNGKRRLRGHLLAQSLAFHGGWQAAAGQRGARIVRIAIHPDLRRRGLGLSLLAAVADDEAQRGTDWLGASFALDAELIGFWQRAGFAALRLGVRREAASGEQALQVVRALSPAAGRVSWEGDASGPAAPPESAGGWVDAARRQFLRHLPLLLADAWRDLDVEVVQALFAGQVQAYPPPDSEARRDLQAFVVGRPLLTCLPALTTFARHVLAEASPHYDPAAYALLVLRLLQLRTDAEVVRELRMPGRDALRQQLAAVVGQWLAGAGPTSV